MVPPGNFVAIKLYGITLGNKVANFFKKRNIDFVDIILNYNNNSILITKKDKNYGFKINCDTRIQSKCIKNFIFINTDNEIANMFRAKPFNNQSVIVENIPLFPAPILDIHNNNLEIKVNEKLFTLHPLIKKHLLIKQPIQEFQTEEEELPQSNEEEN